MSVLILSESYDNSTNYVVEHLNRLNVPYVRINTNLEYNNIISVNIQNEKIVIKFELENKIHEIDKFDLIWVRRGFLNFKTPKISNQFTSSEVESAVNLHIQTEFKYLAEYIAYYIQNSKVCCIGMASSKNINKLIVLHKAMECGINIPTTSIVNKGTLLDEVFKEDTNLSSKPISERLTEYIPRKGYDSNLLINQDYVFTSLKEIKAKKFNYSLFQRAVDIKL